MGINLNPDAYIPIYHRDLLEAVKGWPKHARWAYFVAICYYWGHEHCKGLKNDWPSLKRICECDDAEWAEAKDLIFDNDKAFTLGADGLWHQVRADEEWEKAKKSYEFAVKRATMGANARWKIHRKQKHK